MPIDKVMFRFFTIIFFCLVTIVGYGQTGSTTATQLLKVTLSGVVLDKATGEKLPSAHIRIGKDHAVAVVNSYGFFSVSNNKGNEVELRFQHLGYLDFVLLYDFKKDSSVTISLAPASFSMDSLVIRSEAPGNLLTPSLITMEVDIALRPAPRPEILVVVPSGCSGRIASLRPLFIHDCGSGLFI